VCRAIEDRFAGAPLHADELIAIGVRLRADLLARLQRHDDELTVRPGIENLAEVLVLVRLGFDVDAIACHERLLFQGNDDMLRVPCPVERRIAEAAAFGLQS
jgi:hypothetical protein